jgi:hypothetical protein
VRLAYKDTFTRRPINILAPVEMFLKEFGFTLSKELQQEKWVRRPFVPKEKGRDGNPPMPLKKE